MNNVLSKLLKVLPLLILMAQLSPFDAFSQQKSRPSINDFTAEMEKQDGFYPLYWDENTGKIWLEITALDQEILYYPSLAAGLGSNDIGLDRGKLSGAHVVSFRKSGKKLLMTESNYDYRAITDNKMEKRAVQESFAESILWGFEISAESGNHYLVDATEFALQDAVGAIQSISRSNQGNYKVDPKRSAIYTPRTKAFPKNTEIEATITLEGSKAGSYLRSVTPTPDAVTLRMHHSFVELPDDGYTPRLFDPRAGVNAVSFYDFATPINESIVKRYIRRHRLIKKNPGPAPSEVVEPIIYYIDPGTPEPIRSALMEGTSWWAEAFESAGFINAFQVKLLPDEADPMDIRYNLVQWVHRSTRGWSYGGGITDPRTGEIIKGKVTLGSLRVRQDFLIAQGLIARYLETGEIEDEAMLEMALARMRQLAAHEVGHTLGLPHNYIASAHNRASVMDYPHPSVKFKDDNSLDLSDAYAVGIGEWDKVAIQMAYAEFPSGADEQTEISKMVESYRKKGLDFLSDQDARPTGSAHPKTHLWDNGESAVDELDHVMEVRKYVLDRFNEKKIKMGQPLATLEEVFVPIYLFHRYQVEAAAKLIAGVNYQYTLRGDGGEAVKPVSAEEQVRATESLMATLNPKALAVPHRVYENIPPRPYGFSANARETFQGKTGLTFDPLAPAHVAADLTLSLVLDPQRASRLVAQHAINENLPGLVEIIDIMIKEISNFNMPSEIEASSYEQEIKRTVEKIFLQHLINLYKSKQASEQARSIARYGISKLEFSIQPGGKEQNAHKNYCQKLINQMDREILDPVELMSPIPTPDGSPIGSESYEWLSPICTEQ
ncbi:zinc-dependent metalloprotease [Echinicola sp. CAU 1574]|uniref:Zinc-dependent metalloprotease n=1 Tax=Echinicola arenosa TaxID=2774144 RepID=A0ABR9AGA7_9BACT|nr:zinc-dependent metalloprotease [Echinicola arenosa]MBD8487266.1 zinc-dependent metalloprotease [Echinicola arenosa]